MNTATEQECIAIPQKDGGDTRFFVSSMHRQPLPIKSGPTNSEPAVFGGKVAVRHDYVPTAGVQKAPANHENIDRAVRLLEAWPEIHRQFSEIVREFQPMYLPGTTSSGYVGSMSHQPPATIGSMWATVNDPICLAQAFVHELAHNKLFALGQQFEGSGPLFTNERGELYDSPIRLDVPRPISAVFHGVYAFLHVLSLDLRILGKEMLDQETRRYLLVLLRKNVDRVRIGLQIVAKCAKPSVFGKGFVADTFAWAADELAQAERYLPPANSKQTFLVIGPAGSGKTAFSQRLASALDKTSVSLDLFSWDYWYQTPLLQQILLKAFGKSKVFLLNKTFTSKQKMDIILEMISKQLISDAVLDYLCTTKTILNN